jgi:hypothetical protein
MKITIDNSFIIAPDTGNDVRAPYVKSEARTRIGQDSRVDVGVSIGVFGLDFNPLPARTPPSDPVKKIARVFRRSIKAASLGA